MTDLDKLIDKVETGKATKFSVFNHHDKTWDAVKPHCREASDTYLGSLDAALRLHEALLPGWLWGINSRVDGQGSCCVYEAGKSASVFSADTPARAWLLAILRALKEKGQ